MERNPAVDTLLVSKLHRPTIQRDHVARPRLLERLDEGQERTLTLICAPAGYGKSSLASSWLESSERPSAWLSLDEHDDGLETFVLGLVAALRTMFPEVCPDTVAMLRADALPSPREFALSLIREMSGIGRDFTLVLDDYHVVHDTQVHDLLSELLRHPPRVFHLIMTTRHDPPLPLDRFRARGELSEIRLEGLQFSGEEALLFLKKTLGSEISPSVAAALNDRTEGWAAALRLASLSLTDAEAAERIVQNLGGDHRHVREYLFSEVLSRQSPDMRQCLLKSSILEQMCASLCDTICSADTTTRPELNGAEFLARAERDSLFLISLDGRGEWFRFHHLFRDLLQHQLRKKLPSKEVAGLHGRAAAWLGANGHLEEALQHFLSAGEEGSAADIVRRHRHELMNREEWVRLDNLLNALPNHTQHSDPALLVQKAWNCENRYRYTEMFRIIAELEGLQDVPAPSTGQSEPLQAEIEILRSLPLYVKGEGKAALELALGAYGKLPENWLSQRGFALGISMMASQMTGEAEQAQTLALEALRQSDVLGSTLHTRILIALCHVHWMEADLTRLQRVAGTLRSVARETGLREAADFATYFLGIVDYERGDLEAAEAHLSAVARQRFPSNTQNFIHSAVPLAIGHLLRNQSEKAHRLARVVSDRAFASLNPEAIRVAEAAEAELALRQGELPPASRWAKRFQPSPKPTRWRHFQPELTLAKVLLAEASESSLASANEHLRGMGAHARATHGQRALVDILCLQALLSEQAGDLETSLSTLNAAIERSQPGGLVQPFLDLGAPMARLLSLLAKRNIAVAFVGQLLSAFRTATVPQQQGAIVQGQEGLASTDEVALEPLTRREAEILTLLAQRLTDKEIAEQLFIAPGTVKKHLANLYSKLNVHDRLEAVSKAQDLRIL